MKIWEEITERPFCANNDIYPAKNSKFRLLYKKKIKAGFLLEFSAPKINFFIRNGILGNHRCSHFYFGCDRWGNNNREKTSIVIWIPKHRKSFFIKTDAKNAFCQFSVVLTSTIYHRFLEECFWGMFDQPIKWCRIKL